MDLIFKVILPYKDLNLKGDLNVYNNYNAVNIMPKEKTHSFVINSKELTFKYNLMIDSNFSFPIKKRNNYYQNNNNYYRYNNYYYNDVDMYYNYNNNYYNNYYNRSNYGYNNISYNQIEDNRYIEFTLSINNNSQKIKVKILEAPKIEDEPNKYINKFGLFKLENNTLNKEINYRKGEIYISPFYLNQNYIKIDYQNSRIKVNNIKKNIKIIFLKSNGKIQIENSNDFSNKGIFYDYIPIIGIYLDHWFPLISKYEVPYSKLDITKKEYIVMPDIKEELKSKNNKITHEFLDGKGYKKLIELRNKYKTANLLNKEEIEKQYSNIVNEGLFKKMEDNFKDRMNISENFNFIYFGHLLYKYDDVIIETIKKEFPEEIINNENIKNYLEKFNQFKTEKVKMQYILYLYNIFVELHTIFKKKYDEIKKNKNLIMIDSIPYTELLKINDEYYTFNELSQNNILPSLNQLSNDIEKLTEQIKKTNVNMKEKDDKKILVNPLLSNKFLIIGDKAKIFEKEDDKIMKKEKNEKELEVKTENITITLPDIDYDKNEISLQYLMNFYSRCTLGTRVFPTYIKNAVSLNNEDDIKNAQIYITNLYYYFKTRPLKSEKDYSIISTNEFFESFKIIIGKMKKANISFKSKNDLDSIEIDKSRINTFISLEEDKSIGLRPDKWNKKKPKELKVLQQFEDKLSRNVNY